MTKTYNLKNHDTVSIGNKTLIKGKDEPGKVFKSKVNMKSFLLNLSRPNKKKATKLAPIQN